MQNDKNFRPDRIGAYFHIEWLPLALVTVSGLIYNIGLLATPWFEGRLAQCLTDILDGSATAAAMAILVLTYEPNLVGRLDKLMSSRFNAGLTDRFACSQKAGEMLFGKSPFTVLPNGIDTARFAARDPQRRALLRGELGVADNEILFGHVGRFSAQKNHPGLLKIFAAVRARLPKARLVLLGGGEPGYIEEIQNLARSLGLGDSVIFAGVRSNMQGFYDAMDAFLLPSLFEGLPVVLVEAQTAGLPCFVADTVDKGAAFTDRVHFLPLQDEAAWANTIAGASLRRDPDARRKAVEAGYDIHHSAEILQEFYLRRYAEVTR